MHFLDVLLKSAIKAEIHVANYEVEVVQRITLDSVCIFYHFWRNLL